MLEGRGASVIALAFLILSALVHGLSIWVYPSLDIPGHWSWKAGVAACILSHPIAMVLGTPIALWYRPRWTGGAGGSGLRTVVRVNPRPIRAALTLVLVYAAVNFMYCTSVLERGAPTVSGEKYVLKRNAEVLRVLTPEEYRLHRSRILRLFSGHLLAFYALAIAVYHGRMSRESAESDSASRAITNGAPAPRSRSPNTRRRYIENDGSWSF